MHETGKIIEATADDDLVIVETRNARVGIANQLEVDAYLPSTAQRRIHENEGLQELVVLSVAVTAFRVKPTFVMNDYKEFTMPCDLIVKVGI